MTEILLSMLVLAGLGAVFGLLHVNALAGKGCGLCEGTCTYAPECGKGREDGSSLPRPMTSDNLRLG